ncbi:MAG: helix-turn-helix domain-containing protein [Halobacteriales archaeon]|nr:helix-turn-helix domain-containing protein [Halobacteriales archaeon]
MTSRDLTLHPLVPTLTDGEVFSDARMVNWSPSFDPPRVTVLLYLEGDLDRFGAVLGDTDLVIDYDVTLFGDGRGYAYLFSEPHPLEWELFKIGTGQELLPLFPIQYHPDGSLTVGILGPPGQLQDAVEAIPSGIETSIEQVGEYTLGRPPIPPSLSPRQQEVLQVAFEEGFYEIPREASRADVAERVDCAPSTASEHLQKAERRLVQTVLGQRREASKTTDGS